MRRPAHWRPAVFLAATVFRNRAQEGKRRSGWGDERRCLPMSFVVKHGIENNEELAHTGDERGLGVLTVGAQPQIESSDGGIAAHSRHRRHIQDAPHLCASAPDTTTAPHISTVAVEWCETSQCGDLLAIEHSQFRQLREQSTREHLADPGHGALNSSRSRHKGVSRINSASSASRPESRFSNQRMCSSMLRCKTLGARARRCFSAVSISINWRRRVTSASSAWACSFTNGRASGRTASPKRASTSASSRSVLASLPVARAKSRTCRGLTIATAIPAAARALATEVSRPPVASTITKSAGFVCLSNSRIPTSSLVTEKAPPAGPMNTSSATLATSIPINRFTSPMFHPPQRGLPRLAIRDFFPLQPFGLSAIGVAATFAARRDLAPKGAPVCRSTNSDSSTKSSTYKGVDERVGLVI